MGGAIIAVWNWLTTGWEGADIVGLALTLGGLVATYRQARKAKTVSEETQENVARDIGRIKISLSSFKLLEKVHMALAAIGNAREALVASDFPRVVVNFETVAENMTLLSEEKLSCVESNLDELNKSIAYVKEKIASINNQHGRGNVSENPSKISQVVSEIRVLLLKVQRGLELETFDGNK